MSSPTTAELAQLTLLPVVVAFAFVLQMATIYVPFMNTVLNTDPLTPPELAFALALSPVVFFAVEAEKSLVRRGWLYALRVAGPRPSPQATGVE